MIIVCGGYVTNCLLSCYETESIARDRSDIAECMTRLQSDLPLTDDRRQKR